MKFLLKVIIIYFGEKRGFDYKNYHRCSKLANIWLDIINKINY